jgi:hypothetical protein
MQAYQEIARVTTGAGADDSNRERTMRAFLPRCGG